VLVVIEDLFTEEVERNLCESPCVTVAHLEPIQIPKYPSKNLCYDLKIVPFGS